MFAPAERFGLALVAILVWLAAAAADSPEPLAKLEHGGPVNVVAFSPDGKLLAAGDRDSSIRLWNVATGKLVHKMQLAEGEFLSLSFAPDGKVLASTSTDGWIRLWDVEKGKQIREFHARDRPLRVYVAFAPDGKTLAAGAADGIVSIWDPATAKELYASKPGGRIQSIAFVPGSTVAAALAIQREPTARAPGLAGISFQRRIRLLDAATGKEGPGFAVSGDHFAMSPDGRALAVGKVPVRQTARGEVFLTESATGQERGRIGRRASTAFAFSSDSRFLALADGGDNAILIYDLATGKAVLRLEEHEVEIASLAFSPDGKRLASASGDLSVLLWDTSTLTKRKSAEIKLSDAELAAAWELLAGPDAAKAYQVRNQFLQAPKQAAPFLQAKLKAVPLLDGKRLADLIRDLDSKQFDIRQKAAAELESLGVQAKSALLKVLDGKPSLEVRRRVEDLLSRIGWPQLGAEHVRLLRAVEVLELADTPETRAVLEQFAKPEPPSFLTHEARAAWKRTIQRQGTAP